MLLFLREWCLPSRYNIDVIHRIMYRDKINPRVDGTAFIPPPNELSTSQLLTCLHTPTTSHISEQFQNFFFTLHVVFSRVMTYDLSGPVRGHNLSWEPAASSSIAIHKSGWQPVESQYGYTKRKKQNKTKQKTNSNLSRLKRLLFKLTHSNGGLLCIHCELLGRYQPLQRINDVYEVTVQFVWRIEHHAVPDFVILSSLLLLPLPLPPTFLSTLILCSSHKVADQV